MEQRKADYYAFDGFHIIWPNVKAHAPLPAGAHVDHGVGVVVTESHQNRAAGRGCHGASCSFLDCLTADGV